MKRAVIVCGAKISDYEWVSSHFREGDFFIYCDSGLIHEDRFLSIVDSSAKLIIGDFDSHEKPDTDVEIIVLPHEKDDTDSVYAVKEAIKRGFKDILMIGAIGNRLDHSLVNLYVLKYMLENGVSGTIVDDYSEMYLISDNMNTEIEDYFEYFSLVAISGKATGVTIKDAKYEVENVDILPSYQYATSNEPIKGKTAKISVKSGDLCVIKNRF